MYCSNCNMIVKKLPLSLALFGVLFPCFSLTILHETLEREPTSVVYSRQPTMLFTIHRTTLTTCRASMILLRPYCLIMFLNFHHYQKIAQKKHTQCWGSILRPLVATGLQRPQFLTKATNSKLISSVYIHQSCRPTATGP